MLLLKMALVPFSPSTIQLTFVEWRRRPNSVIIIIIIIIIELLHATAQLTLGIKGWELPWCKVRKLKVV